MLLAITVLWLFSNRCTVDRQVCTVSC